MRLELDAHSLTNYKYTRTYTLIICSGPIYTGFLCRMAKVEFCRALKLKNEFSHYCSTGLVYLGYCNTFTSFLYMISVFKYYFLSTSDLNCLMHFACEKTLTQKRFLQIWHSVLCYVGLCV